MNAFRSAALLTVFVVLAACGGGGGGTGTMNVSMTDAPFPAEGCLETAMITVTEVRVRPAGSEGEEDGWISLDMTGTGPLILDLLDLRAGLTEKLATDQLPTGTYDEIRLVLGDATLTFVDTLAPDQAFKVPSGMSSGLKIKIDPPVVVASGATADVVLDFDLAESFHTTALGGDPTCAELQEGESTVIFHPVIRAENLQTTGVVSGIVSDAEANPVAGVEVSAFVAGTTVDDTTVAAATTFSAPGDLEGVELGAYALLLDAGTYDLYVRAPDATSKTLALAGVVVTAGQILADQNLTLPAAP